MITIKKKNLVLLSILCISATIHCSIKKTVHTLFNRVITQQRQQNYITPLDIAQGNEKIQKMLQDAGAKTAFEVLLKSMRQYWILKSSGLFKK